MIDLADFDLTGRRALVTGGSDGLGRQFTEALLDAGASVVICSRRKDSLDQTVAELSDRFSFISSRYDKESLGKNHKYFFNLWSKYA